MHDFIRKLVNSKTTVAILLWILVLAWAYQYDWVKKPMIHKETNRRTVEEIIATPVDKTTTEAWDNDFKSSIELGK